MGKYIINGDERLVGEVSVSGAKNAVLPILAATVVGGNRSTIFNTPNLRDVDIMEKILISIGCKVERMDNIMYVDSRNLSNTNIPDELVREMRSSIILMGSMLTRCGETKVSYPGGCEIGPRPIDLHLKALREMGAKIDESHGFLYCHCEKLKGCEIQLDYPSVGATENAILAAVRAKGTTVIRNAAREPEIIDLQNYLNKCGAKISGAGTSIIKIEGVEKFKDVEYTIMPDRIVTGTYMAASALTGGEIIIKNVETNHIQAIVAKLKEAGCLIYNDNSSLKVIGPEKINYIEMTQTLPYPGFPTDMQAQMMAVLSIADGTSIISETVFENRFKHADELIRMGADIKIIGKVAIIKGVKELTGAKVKSKDLRGGASLVLAGLAAKGTTEVENIYHIERGYEDLDENLRKLGADIIKVE
ncbi:UDP-N-acetylglucosamine 1-carboxyvinyltransferase [Anaerosalibacter bizertensis]|uniref:UDP-N-acetylglucosamine 1-carboxyvinyltransferase n=1 Tax=Anaerosalibacter bizertensis TaxID=932217 RepID=A0A9Q4ABW8_9FIRM|nr:UDP-N-acetylglucosamine 1-carboxyvinyltransferase [Anaerosalibacter bizertensis]MBV1817802.1 UDP-N-acetylglucosamine 1-carboxyvinyltransferase [Bacteroidales bacterium MSK.15.36]MCB5559169.1 UDP-N-acetylglucosamine 1-carboxyvinyltransferase [Anaerosalibacter bizertensis]MCG4564512.1 UDP-N-acetylglucosamine 1-carboxyvinyltransferase [Anaerosalibacter bizertensis]MCG4581402.1 UDP-N-acetylglucosamine 1-carboxyvinyltransferase [Anaerosalibacter bizertensis]MCG4583965.1 UDP-N-acetylglucosamine 1